MIPVIVVSQLFKHFLFLQQSLNVSIIVLQVHIMAAAINPVAIYSNVSTLE